MCGMDFLRRGNRELIKDINRALVIDQLRKNGPMSRTEVAKQTHLGLSTVTKIVDSLMEQRLVCEVGQGDSCGGRRPIFIDLNYMIMAIASASGSSSAGSSWP